MIKKIFMDSASDPIHANFVGSIKKSKLMFKKKKKTIQKSKKNE